MLQLIRSWDYVVHVRGPDDRLEFVASPAGNRGTVLHVTAEGEGIAETFKAVRKLAKLLMLCNLHERPLNLSNYSSFLARRTRKARRYRRPRFGR